MKDVPGTMKSRRNQFIVLGAIALTLNALFNYLGSNESSLNETLKAGDPFPSFNTSDQNGKPISNSRFAGTPTVYFFFANWCPCSHESIQWVQKGLTEYSQERLAVVGVGIQDQPDRLAQFTMLHRITFPVVTGVAAEDIASASGVKITPTTIFVDGGGIIRSIHVGKIESWTQMQDGVETTLRTSAMAHTSDKGEMP